MSGRTIDVKQCAQVEEINRREKIVEEEESSDINGYKGRRGKGMRLRGW